MPIGTTTSLRPARSLLAGVDDLAAAHGTEALTHHVDSPPGPPQYQENEDARLRLLVESGYELLRDGLRWSYSGSPAHEGCHAPPLLFRSLPEVGEDAFVEESPRHIRVRGTRGSP